MIVKNVQLNSGSQFDLVLMSLKGTRLENQWDETTDLFVIFLLNQGRACTFKKDDSYNRFKEKLLLPEIDSIELSSCVSTILSNEVS